MGISLKLTGSQGAMLSAMIAGGTIARIGAASPALSRSDELQTSIGFVQVTRPMNQFFHHTMKPDGTVRYFAHIKPTDSPIEMSVTLEHTLMHAIEHGFTTFDIKLGNDFLDQTHLSADTATQAIYQGLCYFTQRQHALSDTSMISVQLNLGDYNRTLAHTLLRDYMALPLQTDVTTVAELGQQLFDARGDLSRNSPLAGLGLDVLLDRRAKGERVLQPPKRIAKGALVDDLQRAARGSAAPFAAITQPSRYPQKIVSKFNQRQWQALMSKIKKTRTTFFASAAVGPLGIDKLSAWLAPQIGSHPSTLENLMIETGYGVKETDLYFDEHGLLVGANVQMDRAHNARANREEKMGETDPKGTAYSTGNLGAPFVAENVTLRQFRNDDDSSITIPVGFTWKGTKGKSYDAFMAWYNQPAFVSTRERLLTFEKFEKLITALAPLSTRLNAVQKLLTGNPVLGDLMRTTFAEVAMHRKEAFDHYFDHIMEHIREERTLEPDYQFMALFIEW